VPVKLADHCGWILAEHGDTEPRVFVLDGDLADSDGALHFAHRHPERFLMAGIAEQNMVSVAAGMAEAGRLPWVFSFAAFLCYRAYDQIRIGLSQARQPVTLVGSHAGGLSGRNGKSHAAPNDLALMLSLPSLHVWSPGDCGDVELAVRTILAEPAPSYLRCPRTPIGDAGAHRVGPSTASQTEQASAAGSTGAPQRLPGAPAALRWLVPRRPVALVSTGIASHWALAAAGRLAEAGADVGVLHCLRLRPPGALADELRGVHRIFVVEDHTTFGGLASLIHGLGLPAEITALGWPDDFSGKSGTDEQLLAEHGLSADRLAHTIEAALAARTRG
jgi:transketolase